MICRYLKTEHSVVKSPKTKIPMRPSFFESWMFKAKSMGIGRTATMTSETIVTTA